MCGFHQRECSERVPMSPPAVSTTIGRLRVGFEGGILTQSLLPSYHLFSNIRETRMNTGDFYDLAFCNSFNPFA